MLVGEHRTSQRRLNAAERQVQALELRKSGMTYDAIAQRLGYANHAGARKAVESALRKTIQEPADELRQMECERLDAMLASIWHFVLAGSAAHIDTALRIMQRRAKLIGLDAPAEINHRHVIQQEVERMVVAGVITPDEAAATIAEAEAIIRGLA